jgi:hypothetical protein
VASDPELTADDVRRLMPFMRWQALAEELAEALRGHENWKDCDACILALDRYDEMIEGTLNDGTVCDG